MCVCLECLVMQNQITLHVPWPNLQICTDNPFLSWSGVSWHGNMVTLATWWSRPVRSSLWLSFHFSGFWLGHLLNCCTYSVLLTWRCNFPFAFSVVQEESLNTWTQSFFAVSHFQMLFDWLGNKIKPHKIFHQTLLLLSSSPASSSPFTQSHPSTHMKSPFLLPTHREFYGQLLAASILSLGLIERFISEQTSESFTNCV